VRTRAAIFLGLYVCVIVYLTLFPWDFQFYARGQELRWAPLNARRPILDAVLNVFLFVPLGAAGFVAFGRRWKAAVGTVLAAALLSWSIEWLQMWTPKRYANLTDFASNTLGAAIGCAAAWEIGRRGWWHRAHREGHVARWSLSAIAGLFLIFWLLWHAFPFIPAIALPRLKQIVSSTPWSWLTFAETMVGFAALTRIVGRSPWLALAFLVLPTQIALMDRSLSYPAIAGAAVGGTTMLAAGSRANAVWPWLLSLWLVFSEFRPFTFSTAVQPMSWEPFRTWYDFSVTSYYATIFGKLFLYTAVVWSLRPKLGWVGAVGVPALILAAGEWSQQYLPGRTPETTDLVILAGGAVLLGLCSRD
jgi:VanZ family protein